MRKTIDKHFCELTWKELELLKGVTVIKNVSVEDYEDDNEMCFIVSFRDQNNRQWKIDFFHSLGYEEIASAIYAYGCDDAKNYFLSYVQELIKDELQVKNEEVREWIECDYLKVSKLKQPFWYSQNQEEIKYLWATEKEFDKYLKAFNKRRKI